MDGIIEYKLEGIFLNKTWGCKINVFLKNGEGGSKNFAIPFYPANLDLW